MENKQKVQVDLRGKPQARSLIGGLGYGKRYLYTCIYCGERSPSRNINKVEVVVKDKPSSLTSQFPDATEWVYYHKTEICTEGFNRLYRKSKEWGDYYYEKIEVAPFTPQAKASGFSGES